MAISPWTRPLEMKIAPLPFEALAYGYEKRQKREDEGYTLSSTLEDDLLKIKALDVDKPKRNAKIQEFRNQVSTLYDQNKGNYAQMIPALRDLSRKIKYETTYGDLADINAKANEYATLSSEFDKAEKEGKFGGLGQYMKNYALSLPLMQYEAVGGHSRDSQSGVSNKVGWGDLSQLPNVGEKVSDWVTKYKADKFAGKTLVPTNAGYLVQETNELVKYDDVARDAMTWALQNPDFARVNQVIGSFVPADAVREISLGKDKNGKEIKSILTGKTAGLYDFYSGAVGALAGRESYIKSDVDMLKDWEKAMKMRQDQIAPPVQTQTFESAYTDYRNLENTWEQDKFETDRQGNIITTGTASVIPMAERATRVVGKDAQGRDIVLPVGPEETAYWGDRGKANVARNVELKKKYDNIRTQVPALQGKSDTYVKDFMSKAYTNSGISFSEFNLPDFNYKELTPQILGDLTTKAVFASTAEGGSLKGTFTSVAKELGFESPEQIKAFKDLVQQQASAGNIKLAPFSPLGKSGYSVELVDNEGKPVKLVISSSKELENTFNWVYPLYENFEKGKLGFSTTKLFSDDVGTYTGVTSRDGEPVWYAGRVLSKENTDKNLKAMGKTKQEAEAMGIQFTPDGNLIDPDINKYILQAKDEWLNSKYMKPFRTGYSKNIYNIGDSEEE